MGTDKNIKLHIVTDIKVGPRTLDMETKKSRPINCFVLTSAGLMLQLVNSHNVDK